MTKWWNLGDADYDYAERNLLCVETSTSIDTEALDRLIDRSVGRAVREYVKGGDIMLFANGRMSFAVGDPGNFVFKDVSFKSALDSFIEASDDEDMERLAKVYERAAKKLRKASGKRVASEAK